MLESMRRGAQSWVAKGLFGILVASFAMWGVADVFRGWGQGSLASIGGTQISQGEFQREFQRELEAFSRDAKQKLTPEQGKALGLDRRVFDLHGAGSPPSCASLSHASRRKASCTYRVIKAPSAAIWRTLHVSVGTRRASLRSI